MKFFSQGKLLLSGEYLVMNGALALALPVKFGQEMLIEKREKEAYILWETFIKEEKFFEAEIDISKLKAVKTSNERHSDFILNLLKSTIELNPSFRKKLLSLDIKTRLNYEIKWGLGSSASLISNMAFFADVDPFKLHWKVSAGSGYDIACARSHKPLLYRVENKTPEIEYISFKPVFHDHIYFIYSGRKQNSIESIEKYFKGSAVTEKELETISALTLNFIDSESLFEFDECIREHEAIISKILNTKTVKEEKFPDFEGEIKSLGAWGGDFIMVTIKDGREKLEEYFHKRDLKVIFSYNELILS